MSPQNKNAHSTNDTNLPLYRLLYRLSNEKLEKLKAFKRRSKDLNEAAFGLKACEILELRRNIDILSRSQPYKDKFPPLDHDESTKILSCFSSIFTSLPFKFLSEYHDTGGKQDSVYPISLYVRIDDATTLEQIKDGWAEIMYWRDYIRRAQGPQMGGEAEEFLFDLHTKNLKGKGYGSLAKEVNDTLERLLTQDISNNDWIKNFEAELHEYLSKKPGGSGHPFEIIKAVRGVYNSPNPATKKLRLEKVYKAAPIKVLKALPKENPYGYLQTMALMILMILRFKEAEARQCIEEAVKDIMQGGNMKKIVTPKYVRETLRWWRKKNDYPSPEKAGMG